VVLGYALRFQFWLLDSLGIVEPRALTLVVGPLSAGLFLAISGLDRLRTGRSGALRTAAGVACLTLAVVGVGAIAPDRVAGVLRVDVLHAIGASLIVIGSLSRARTRPRLLAALALTVAALAPTLALSLPRSLSPALADWIAARPGGTALFPLAPWLAYALCGAALAPHFARTHTHPLTRTHSSVTLTILAVLFALATHEALPSGHALAQSLPPLVDLFRFTSSTAAALALFMLCAAAHCDLPVLGTLGRASLLVYWFHLTFAYGILSRPFHASLAPHEWAAGAVTLIALMWAIAQIRSGIRDAIRRRGTRHEEIRLEPLSRTGALL
jgi:uncharacterized membrane protein